MAYQKLQAGRALAVIPSDTVNIPNVSVVAKAGTTTGANSLSLIDSAGNFIVNRVNVGDIVYAGTVAAKVTAVSNATTLLVTIAVPAATAYTVYSQKDNPSNGCVLYCGGTGNVDIMTTGGDIVSLKGMPAGQFIPVQVLRVNATSTATNIIALW
jgi:hypothetical protein